MKILSKRLKKYLFNSCKGTFLELYENLCDWWERHNKSEAERLQLSISSFQCCAAKIQATEDGLGVKINNNRDMDLFTIAVASEIDETQTALKYSADLQAIDKVYEIAKQRHVDFSVTQIIYKPGNGETNEENRKEKRKIRTAAKTEAKQGGEISDVYKWQQQDIEKFFEQSYRGEHTVLKQLVVAGISTQDEEETGQIVAETQNEFKQSGINTDVCYGGQMRALKALIPSNELMQEHMIKVLSNTAAAFWPGRTPLKTIDEFGIHIGYLDEGKDAGIPLYWNPENPQIENANVAILGGSGQGKTTLVLNLLKNAVACDIGFWYFSPKQDFGTDAINFIKALKGNIINVGPKGCGLRPLKITWDPEIHGDDVDSMYSAYIKSKERALYFFYMLIGSAFSAPMQKACKKSLTGFYIKEGYLDEDKSPINPEKWKDPKEIPRIKNYAQLIEEWIKDDDPEHKQMRSSLKALLGYLVDFDRGESLYWMDEETGEDETEFDITKKYTVVDLSDIPEKYQDAITVLLVSNVNSKIKVHSKEALERKGRYILAFDEAPKILKNPGMQEFLPSLTREIRSSGNSFMPIGQDVKGMKPILPVVKSNCSTIIFMCGMSGADINELSGEFPLDDEDKRILGRPGKGRFYFYGNFKVPGRVIPLKTERKVFFNEDEIEQTENENELPLSSEDYLEPEYELIDPKLKYIVDTFGVINKNWIKKQRDIEIKGFTKNTKISPVTDYLSKVNYLSNDIAFLEKINGETPDHWVTKCLMGGESILNDIIDVVVNTHGDQGGDKDPDVTGISAKTGQRVGWEYAHPGSRSIGELRKQKNNHLKYCDIWRCICQQKNEDQVRAAVNETKVKVAIGEDFCLTRGEEFGKFIKSFKIEKQELDILEELKRLEKEDELEELSELEKSSFPQGRTIDREIIGLEVGEVTTADGTLTEGVA
ncbi:hypothetical protein [Methanosarcina sp.]|uniref:hypothetical protein n=1 Tax=Methanosarcina sp. TaxID=2213 RepID=UPI003BB5E1BC